jgi:DNA-binding FrmR family transcriptional regulator
VQSPSPEVKTQLKSRLSRIEGQARGVKKMLDEDRDCREVLQQLSAMHAALQNATQLYMRSYARECLLDELTPQNRAQVVDELLDLMERVR